VEGTEALAGALQLPLRIEDADDAERPVQPESMPQLLLLLPESTERSAGSAESSSVAASVASHLADPALPAAGAHFTTGDSGEQPFEGSSAPLTEDRGEAVSGAVFSDDLSASACDAADQLTASSGKVSVAAPEPGSAPERGEWEELERSIPSLLPATATSGPRKSVSFGADLYLASHSTFALEQAGSLREDELLSALSAGPLGNDTARENDDETVATAMVLAPGTHKEENMEENKEENGGSDDYSKDEVGAAAERATAASPTTLISRDNVEQETCAAPLTLSNCAASRATSYATTTIGAGEELMQVMAGTARTGSSRAEWEVAVVEEGDEEEGDGSQAGSCASSFVMKAQPVLPTLFKIGILNPDEARHDPAYWLAKSLGDLTAEERRQYRIRRLQLLRREDELRRRVRLLRERRDEVVEDAVDLLAPVMERLQPLIDRAAPIVDRVSKRSLQAARSGLRILREITQTYGGRRLKDVIRFGRLIKQLQRAGLKTLQGAVAARANSGGVAHHSGTGVAENAFTGVGRRVGPVEHEVLAVITDMLEELEYREVEDEVEAVLLDVCAAIEAAAVREQVLLVLNDACSLVEARTEKTRQERLAPMAPKQPVPLEDSGPSDYDFERLVQHLNIDAYGAVGGRLSSKLAEGAEQEDEEGEADAGSEGDGGDEESALQGSQSADGEQRSAATEGQEEENSEEGEEADDEDGDADGDDGASGAEEEEDEEEVENGGVVGGTGADDDAEEDDGGDEEDQDGDDEDDEDEEEGTEEGEDGEEDEEDGAGSVNSELRGRLQQVRALDEEAASAAQELVTVTAQLLELPAVEGAEEAGARSEVAGVLDDLCCRVEVRCVLEDLCAAVEGAVEAEAAEEVSLFRDLSELDISGVSAASSAAADLALEERLVGCEITFMIFVGPEQRQLEGLADIEAEDIAIMLQQQLYDPDAPLQQGKYTAAALEVRSETAHKRQRFDTWEGFYTHLVHPSFFGYSSKLTPARAPQLVGEDGLVNGRLQSGTVPMNPTLLFTEREKDTFQELNNRPLLRPPGERVKREDVSDDDEASAGPAGSKAGGAEGDLDLNVDEFAQDVRRLKLFRPNMSALTAKDIQRLRRVHKAFEERYEETTRRGLVGGAGLRPEQFQALKDRDSAYRIYRTARQKFKHVNKHLSDELVLPPLEVTHIDHATFEGWVQEVRAEDHQRLMEARALAAKRKKVLQQEAQLRRLASQKRFWIVDTFIGACESPLDVGHAFEEQMLKAEIQREFLRQKEESGAALPESGGSAADKLLKELQEQQRAFKQAVIAEEKRTRKLFEFAVRWSRKRDGQQRSQSQPPSVPASAKIGARRGEGGVEAEAASELGSDSGPVLDGALVAVPAVEVDLGRPQTATTTATRPSAAESTGEEAPSLLKAHLHEYLAVAHRAVVREERRRAREARRAAREARAAEKERKLQSLRAFHGKGGAKGAGVAVEVGLEGEEEEEELSSDEGTEAELLSPLASPSPLRGGAAPFSFAATELELSPEEFRLVSELQWVRTVAKYAQFQKCLLELPTLDDATFARDELIQVTYHLQWTSVNFEEYANALLRRLFAPCRTVRSGAVRGRARVRRSAGRAGRGKGGGRSGDGPAQE
jgi:hypothetical protein